MATYLLTLNGSENASEDEAFNTRADMWNQLSNEARDEMYFRWSTGRNTKIQDGDRVILVRLGNKNKLGDGRRGIIMVGHADGEVFQEDHWLQEKSDKGIPANYVKIVPVWMDQEPVVTVSALQERFPDTWWTPQSNGNLVPEAVSDELWREHPRSSDTKSRKKGIGELAVPPVTIPPEIERKYREVVTKQRVHQAKFRAYALVAAEQGYGVVECYICGFDAVDLLEAAHVIADSKGGKATVQNAILLCPTHHKALDRGYYEVVPGTWPDWEIYVRDTGEHFVTAWVEEGDEEDAPEV